MATGTPATARLDTLGLAYHLHAYDHDPRSTAFGDEAVAALDVEPDRFFKTLIVDVEASGPDGGRRHPLACAVVPVSGKLELKAFARAIDAKRVSMADITTAERTTGYVRGGISPVGQKAHVPCLVDETAMLFDTIFVSAGQRGLSLEIAPADLLTAIPAQYAALCDAAE